MTAPWCVEFNKDIIFIIEDKFLVGKADDGLKGLSVVIGEILASMEGLQAA